MDKLYDMIFKRHSFRKYSKDLRISENELEDINKKLEELVPLVDSIKIKSSIVKREKTNAKSGEYCLLIYSEEKENYLLNVGYMFEQLDLYLASKNIGVCWYGMGKVKTDDKERLKYVIMMTFGKADESEFRKDYTKAKRKNTSDVWTGDHIEDIAEIAKYAPSAVNSQPWRVVCENGLLNVYRANKSKLILPKIVNTFYNPIDMGIYLCILEQTMNHNGMEFKRTLHSNDKEADLIHIATYELK